VLGRAFYQENIHKETEAKSHHHKAARADLKELQERKHFYLPNMLQNRLMLMLQLNPNLLIKKKWRPNNKEKSETKKKKKKFKKRNKKLFSDKVFQSCFK